ncbi:MAG: hypothetical protein DI538_06260 [Azospira oryzae]|nr:MAG: hypothetical protein DI538_06260 [Azospira oryzae]
MPRTDREKLLQIIASEFFYEDLVRDAEEKIQLLDELFKKSDLPDAPDSSLADSILVEIREAFYRGTVTRTPLTFLLIKKRNSKNLNYLCLIMLNQLHIHAQAVVGNTYERGSLYAGWYDGMI